jgi:hypothetical protein
LILALPHPQPCRRVPPLDRNLGDAHQMFASLHQREPILVNAARRLAGIEFK